MRSMKKFFSVIKSVFRPIPKQPTVPDRIQVSRERLSARLFRLATHHGIESEVQLVTGVACALNWMNEARAQGFVIAKVDPNDPREFYPYDKAYLLAPKYKDEAGSEPLTVKREDELSDEEIALRERADDIVDDISDDTGLSFGEVAYRAMRHYRWSLAQSKRGFDIGARSGQDFEKSPVFEGDEEVSL